MSKFVDLGIRSETLGQPVVSPVSDEFVRYPSVYLDKRKDAMKPGTEFQAEVKFRVRSVTKQDDGNFSVCLDMTAMKSDNDNDEPGESSDSQSSIELMLSERMGKKK